MRAAICGRAPIRRFKGNVLNIIWDFLAGLSTAGLLLPEAVAYALIAGVTPAHAIVAALCGLSVYALVGHSRFAVVAPTSSSAALLAAAIGSLGLQGTGPRLMAMSALVFLTGLMFLGVAVARLGNLSGFVSRAVLRGFSFGLAITIVIKQAPLIVGIEGLSGSLWTVISGLVQHFAEWNLISLGVGAAGMIVLLLLKRIRGVPAAFVVLIMGISLSYFFDLSRQHVHLLGTLQFDTIRPSLPDLQRAEWLRLLELAPPLFLIIFAESWGSIRNLALVHNQPVDANRELAALGAANIASSLFQGLAVGAGFSASSANESAGARSRFAGLFAALALLTLVVFAMPLIAYLPEPILAAVVVSALTHALNPTPLLRLWKIDRDQYIALAAALAVLVFGVLIGMLSAIALSLLALVNRLSAPTVTRLGHLGDSHDFVDIARFPLAIIEPDIMILRPAQPVFFANAEGIFNTIRANVAGTKTQAIIISFEESSDFDSTALDCLAEFKTQMEKSHIELYFARVRLRICEAMSRYDGGALADPTRQTQSVADAYQQAQQTLALRRP